MTSEKPSFKTVVATLLVAAFFYYIDYRGGIIQCLVLLIATLYQRSNLPRVQPIAMVLLSIAFYSLTVFAVAFMEDFFYYTGAAESIERLSHRGLNSGRQLLWPLSIEYIIERPVFGHGAGFLLSDVTEFVWSTHNTFMQIALQAGLIGALLTFLIFVNIYHIANDVHRTRRNRLIGSFAIVFCIFVHNTFETSLIQNSMPVALIHWLIIGVLTTRRSSLHRHASTTAMTTSSATRPKRAAILT